VRRILCLAEPRGSATAMRQILEAAGTLHVQAVALVGDVGGDDRPAGYRSVFRALGQSGLPGYWVPGPADAPVEEYLREAHNMEVVFPFLHGVHGSAASAPGSVLVAGVGGRVSDDPSEHREELAELRYPRWEVEYRLKVLRELKPQELVLLFATPPAHKGTGRGGSDVLAELVGTYRARIVVCGGEPMVETLGRSVVVAPGSIAEGCYAVADLHAREAELGELAVVATSREGGS
jgi:uncharacterized protein